MEGTIIFIDEIDALAVSRDGGDIHEATRRILSLILQRIEGFQGKSKSLLICATNRPQDLDSAMLSRFDLSIQYPMPDFETRKAIFCRYAKQLANDHKGEFK
jgi:SpoVK/Ycf46/Vps4 family AAA+-type ATPase